jgi:hypothetical protein
MNGAIEEGGKVAGTAIDAMRSQPLAIALIVVNFTFLGVGAWFAHDLFEATKVTLQTRDALIRDLIRGIASCPTPIQIPRQKSENQLDLEEPLE